MAPVQGARPVASNAANAARRAVGKGLFMLLSPWVSVVL
jgi:hypothetical protein